MVPLTALGEGTVGRSISGRRANRADAERPPTCAAVEHVLDRARENWRYLDFPISLSPHCSPPPLPSPRLPSVLNNLTGLTFTRFKSRHLYLPVENCLVSFR